MTSEAEAIQDTLARYCHSCDDGDFDALVQVFTSEGTFTYGDRTVVGRADLGAYFAAVQTPDRRGKHLVTNTVVRFDGGGDGDGSGDRAVVRSDWLFLAFVDGVLTPRLTGRYDDVLVRDGAGWLIAERVVTPLQPAP